MGKLLAAISCVLFVSASASEIKAITCGPHLNMGAVGSCVIENCSASRGPTNCILGQCHCKDGFCRYPQGFLGIHVETRRCYARIPDGTCHLTRTCWSGGGFWKSFCNHGLCMCNFGYYAKPGRKIGKDGKTTVTYECTKGFGPGDEKMSELSDEDKAANARITMVNVMIASLWAFAILASIVGGCSVAYNKYRRNTMLHDVNYVLLG